MLKYFLVVASFLSIIGLIGVKSANFISFSDSAKYADAARNMYLNGEIASNFSFYDVNIFVTMKDGPIHFKGLLPVNIISHATSFYIFGISDFAVMATSFFYFLLSLIFVFLLAQKIYKSELVSILSTVAVGFNYDLIKYATSGASESPFIFELLAGNYFLSIKKWWGNVLGLVFMVLMYLTRPQAIIYIFGLILYYFISNFTWKKGLIYTFISFLVGTLLYALFSKQGLVAVTQNLPGMAVSDSLRGSTVDFNLLVIVKKVFYNLYNFYKAIPQIMNPYLFALFVIGVCKKYSPFNFSVLFMMGLTFLVTALTIPFYRYLHPVVPLIYIVGVATMVEIFNSQFLIFNEFSIFNFKITKKRFVNLISLIIILFFAVGQTLGILLLDTRFERKMHNVDKAPIYAEMSYKLKEITGEQDVILTNLDTWGSWYGERKTIWFPLTPNHLSGSDLEIDYIYLTSYKMDDDNYYMGEEWREIFENPKTQKVLSNYKYVGEYEFKAEDNYERENGRAVLLVKKD